nr:AMP deaminase [Tanacetum cinerariifolium]
MDPYAMHLAMAALVGASFVAVSAYYMHRKTLNQLLEFAKTLEKDNNLDDDYNKNKGGGRRNRRGAAAGGEDEDGFLVGLPKLHTLSEGKSTSHTGLAKRASLVLRPTSPKSPVASASAFESVEGSDDDVDVNENENANLDAGYLHTNGNAGPENANATANGEQLPIAAAALIRSHSVSGDLHGVQPDPVAADILRKEPEQETFVRLRITPYETPSPDEAEVYKALQVCLEMRDSYVFRESIAPWDKEVISDPSTPKRNPNPFDYIPASKTNHYFEMEDGVIHVYANKDSFSGC